MASPDAKQAAFPPLIPDQSKRLVLLPSVSPAARAIAEDLSGLVVEVPTVGDIPVPDPEPGDVLVHGFPDVYGRVLGPPTGWNTMLVCERVALPFVDSHRPMIEAGPFPTTDPRLLAGALRVMFKTLIQQRRVRPVFENPPLLGLAFVAPEGIELPGQFGAVERPFVAGLPDLVVIRPVGSLPPGTQRYDPPRVVVA